MSRKFKEFKFYPVIIQGKKDVAFCAITLDQTTVLRLIDQFRQPKFYNVKEFDYVGPALPDNLWDDKGQIHKDPENVKDISEKKITLKPPFN